MQRSVKHVSLVAGALAAFAASAPTNAEAGVHPGSEVSRRGNEVLVSPAAREKIVSKRDEFRLAARRKKSPTFGDSKFNKSKFARVTTPGPSFVQASPSPGVGPSPMSRPSSPPTRPSSGRR